MTSPFPDLLSPSLVNLDLRAADEERAIRTVAELLDGHPEVTNFPALASEVIDRERLCPTAMGHGVAFPHARTNAVRQVVMAIGRSAAGIPFKEADEEVHFIFVIGTPPDRVAQYIALVGKLARLLKNDGIRQRLLAAPTAEGFLDVLRSGA